MFLTRKKPDCTEESLRVTIETQSPDKAAAQVLGCLYEKIRALIFSNRGQETDFEEIFDDVYVVVWQLLSQKKFRPVGQISSYVLAIARNKWMDEWRRRQKIALVDSPDLPLDKAITDIFQELDDDEHHLLRHRIVSACLEELNEPCRSILKLRYFKELSWVEVASTLGKNKDVVESTATRCKKRLREMFEKQWNPNY